MSNANSAFSGITISLIVLAVFLILAVLLIAWAISTYNNLVRTREFVKNGMGQIAAQVESRWDAVSNLIEATKKYSEHEATVIAQTTQARTALNNGSSVSEVEHDDAAFQNILSRIIAVAENYPDLKASSVYQNAMSQIGQFENNVRHARMIFNDSVTKYNRVVLSFPSSIVASLFKFREGGYFQNQATKNEMPSW